MYCFEHSANCNTTVQVLLHNFDSLDHKQGGLSALTTRVVAFCPASLPHGPARTAI